MCEEYDTWQHILYYYPNGLVPAVHFCEDCRSKYHDTKRAEKRRKIIPEAVSPNPNPSDSTNRPMGGAICTGRDVQSVQIPVLAPFHMLSQSASAKQARTMGA